MTDSEAKEAIARSDRDLVLLDSVGIIAGGRYETRKPDAARRVVLILNCQAQRFPQRRLGHRTIYYYYRQTSVSLFKEVDAFLDGMASVSASVRGIDKLSLSCFARRADPWRRFAKRYGPSVHCLTIDASHAEVTEAVCTCPASSHWRGSRWCRASGIEATRAIQAALRSVPECPGIQSIEFKGKLDGGGSDAEMAQAEYRSLAHAVAHTRTSISGEIEEMLLHCNTTLQQIEGHTYESDAHERRISRLLLLNRYGEDFVANATSVPMELWGDVLMRIGKEECNFVVTKLVRRAVEGLP